MSVKVRRPAILFALFSSIYWLTFQSFSEFVFVSRTVTHRQPPTYLIWLVTGLPSIAYAVICLLFCHWLARRVARQVATLPKD